MHNKQAAKLQTKLDSFLLKPFKTKYPGKNAIISALPDIN